jgi:hypothetical protein
MPKTYAYKVFDSDGAYITSWTDEVISDFVFSEELNSAGSIIDLDIARIENFGDGTDIAIGNQVEVTVFFGQYVDWIDHADNEIVDHDDNNIVFADGAPSGRTIFSGIITRVIPKFGADYLTVTLASRGIELDNTVIEDEALNANTFSSGGVQGTTPWGNYFSPFNTSDIAQVFTPTATDHFKYVQVVNFTSAANWPEGTTYTFRMKLYNGNNPASPGTLIDEKAITYTSRPISIFFRLPTQPVLTFGQSYIMMFSIDEMPAPGSDHYYFNMISATGSGYSGGNLWLAGNNLPGPPIWSELSGTSLVFGIMTTGGDTTVPYNSYDPSNTLKAILDNNVGQGGVVTYTDDSIDDTLTNTSYTFRLNTVLEGINKVLQLAPSNWYWYLDQAENIIHFHEQSTTPDVYFTLGKEIESLELEETLEEVVNVVYFSGGDTGSGENLFIKVQNDEGLEEWPRFVERVSDNRVTDAVSARIIANNILERSANPRYKTTLVINADVFHIENLTLGMVIGFKNFNNYIDDLQLQVVSRSYTPDNVTINLDTLLPKVSKRVEDIRRNLDLVNTQNNPDAPTT